jgi:hypothetical protein
MMYASCLCALIALLSPAVAFAQNARDSAGVRIIDNKAPAWTVAKRWRIAAAPSVTIGLEDGEEPYLLSRVFAARRLPNGEIVVGNSGSGELRFFGANGKFIRASGRRGGGPGEFHEFSSLIMCSIPGDEMVVADGGLRRVHVFTIAGAYKRSFTYQHEAAASPPGLRSCFADGTLLTLNVPVAALGGDPGTLIPSTTQYFRYDTNGRSVAKLAEVPDQTRYVNKYGSITHYPFVPFTPESYAAAGGHVTYLNYGGGSFVERRGADGKLEAIIRWQAPRTRTSAVYSRYVTAGLEAMTNQQRRAQYASYYAKKLPIPDLVPVVGFMIVDELEHPWVKRYQLPWDTIPTYEVFDPNGRWLGQVSAPPRLDVYQIGKDYVLGRQRDELGVERVVVYPLERR